MFDPPGAQKRKIRKKVTAFLNKNNSAVRMHIALSLFFAGAAAAAYLFYYMVLYGTHI